MPAERLQSREIMKILLMAIPRFLFMQISLGQYCSFIQVARPSFRFIALRQAKLILQLIRAFAFHRLASSKRGQLVLTIGQPMIEFTQFFKSRKMQICEIAKGLLTSHQDLMCHWGFLSTSLSIRNDLTSLLFWAAHPQLSCFNTVEFRVFIQVE